MLSVRTMRESNGSFQGMVEVQRLKETIFLSLNKAETVFEKGMTVYPAGVRSAYLVGSVRVLKAVLHSDEDIFVNPEKPIDGKPDIVKQPSRDLQWQLGYLREDLFQERQYDFLERTFIDRKSVV